MLPRSISRSSSSEPFVARLSTSTAAGVENESGTGCEAAYSTRWSCPWVLVPFRRVGLKEWNGLSRQTRPSDVDIRTVGVVEGPQQKRRKTL